MKSSLEILFAIIKPVEEGKLITVTDQYKLGLVSKQFMFMERSLPLIIQNVISKENFLSKIRKGGKWSKPIKVTFVTDLQLKIGEQNKLIWKSVQYSYPKPTPKQNENSIILHN